MPAHMRAASDACNHAERCFAPKAQRMIALADVGVERVAFHVSVSYGPPYSSRPGLPAVRPAFALPPSQQENKSTP